MKKIDKNLTTRRVQLITIRHVIKNANKLHHTTIMNELIILRK